MSVTIYVSHNFIMNRKYFTLFNEWGPRSLPRGDNSSLLRKNLFAYGFYKDKSHTSDDQYLFTEQYSLKK